MPAAQLAAALGAKIYTIGIGIEQPCQLPAFDPATGQAASSIRTAMSSPRLVLQPANYSVLGKMSQLVAREILSRHEPPRTAEHLRRD